MWVQGYTEKLNLIKSRLHRETAFFCTMYIKCSIENISVKFMTATLSFFHQMVPLLVVDSFSLCTWMDNC